MKKLLGILAAAFSVSAAALTPAWNLTEVGGGTPDTTGFVYHSSVVGTQTGNKVTKVISGIRMVCALRGDSNTMIAIYWNGMTGNRTQPVSIKVDKKLVVLQQPGWHQDGPVMVKRLGDEPKLLEAMQQGQTITVEWTIDAVKYVSIVSLKGFAAGYSKFNEACK